MDADWLESFAEGIFSPLNIIALLAAIATSNYAKMTCRAAPVAPFSLTRPSCPWRESCESVAPTDA
jgi:hypothetical protein